MATNLPENQQTTISQTSYFDNFYNSQHPVSGQQYDAVYTFFLSRTSNNKEAAKSLTAGLLSATYENGIDPMVLLDDFKKYTNNDNFKTALISLFNRTRRNTSKIGFTTNTAAAPKVSRNIRS